MWRAFSGQTSGPTGCGSGRTASQHVYHWDGGDLPAFLIGDLNKFGRPLPELRRLGQDFLRGCHSHGAGRIKVGEVLAIRVWQKVVAGARIEMKNRRYSLPQINCSKIIHFGLG
jgi:hypothetical protein